MRFAKYVLFNWLPPFAGTVMSEQYRALHFTMQFTRLAWLPKGTAGISKRVIWTAGKNKFVLEFGIRSTT